MSAPQPAPAAPSGADSRQYEPSMEEILASIRRIIADDQFLPNRLSDISAAPESSASLHVLRSEPATPEPTAAEPALVAPQEPAASEPGGAHGEPAAEDTHVAPAAMAAPEPASAAAIEPVHGAVEDNPAPAANIEHVEPNLAAAHHAEPVAITEHAGTEAPTSEPVADHVTAAAPSEPAASAPSASAVEAEATPPASASPESESMRAIAEAAVRDAIAPEQAPAAAAYAPPDGDHEAGTAHAPAAPIQTPASEVAGHVAETPAGEPETRVSKAAESQEAVSDYFDPPQEYDRPGAGRLGAAPLFSEQTDNSVGAAFKMLAASRLADNSSDLLGMTREMIRPLLRAWLDDNLPSLVERLVRDEIERVARGGR